MNLVAENRKMAWTRLIRFESGGTAFFGEPEIANSEELLDKLESGNLYANVYVGDSVHSLSTEESMGRKKVDKIMDLLTPKDVPIIKCVGLNYIKHSKEILCDFSFSVEMYTDIR